MWVGNREYNFQFLKFENSKIYTSKFEDSKIREAFETLVYNLSEYVFMLEISLLMRRLY